MDMPDGRCGSGRERDAGRARAAGELTIVSDVSLLSGDPQLRHLIIETDLPHGPARFQLLLGCRRQLPPAITPAAVIGLLPGLAVYDALHDGELAAVLLDGIAAQRTAGALQFVREPAASFADWPDSRLLAAEQSNTSLIFADAVILKVLRRLFGGANPDLEVADALTRLGSTQVAAPFGWIQTQLDGEPVLLAVLSEYLAGARDGWTLATQGLAGLYSGQIAELPFLAEAKALGLATARLHADMASAFGSRGMTQPELAELAATLARKLDQAVAAIPDLRAHEARIRAAYAELAHIGQPVTIQRIHGDYHLGQVLHSRHGWVALDFEGEPAAPLAERRALAPALRDVAGMLRSFDYAARHQLVGHPARQQLATTADTWVARCQEAFCAGYADGSGADPSDQAALLRALTLEKAVYEVMYEFRHRPAWLSIPLDYVAAA
jgi:maltokinase